MGYRGDRRPIPNSNGRSLDDVRSRISGLISSVRTASGTMAGTGPRVRPRQRTRALAGARRPPDGSSRRQSHLTAPSAGGPLALGDQAMTEPDVENPERDVWDRIGELRWQQVVLLVAALGAFIALCFSPAATCSLRISDSPTTTTTVAR